MNALFVDEIPPGGRCHLNGVALELGEPRYATALGTTANLPIDMPDIGLRLDPLPPPEADGAAPVSLRSDGFASSRQ
jgi:hypothetical protein